MCSEIISGQLLLNYRFVETEYCLSKFIDPRLKVGTARGVPGDSGEEIIAKLMVSGSRLSEGLRRETAPLSVYLIETSKTQIPLPN